MELFLAKECLNLCEREELRDHAFGDREIVWTFEGQEVAGGYFGSTGQSVWINKLGQPGTEIGSFEGDEARELSSCGKLKALHRNDMQGDAIPEYRGY